MQSVRLPTAVICSQSGLIHISIDCYCYISFPLQLLQPIEPLSRTRMVLLLLPLLILLDLGQTQALAETEQGQPTDNQEIQTYNPLATEDPATILFSLLPPYLEALVRERRKSGKVIVGKTMVPYPRIG